MRAMKHKQGIARQKATMGQRCLGGVMLSTRVGNSPASIQKNHAHCRASIGSDFGVLDHSPPISQFFSGVVPKLLRAHVIDDGARIFSPFFDIWQ